MKKKKRFLECSLTYGDASSSPIDSFRKYHKLPLNFNYDCTFKMIPKTGCVEEDEISSIKIHFISTKFKYIPRGEEFFNYTLNKICYELRDDKDKEGNIYKRIQHLKLIFLNKEKKEEVLLDTSNGKKLPEAINIFEGEFIEYVKVYLKYEALCGIEIITNESEIINESYKIGSTNGNDIESIIVKDDKKIIAGLGCEANEEQGINSIYFYSTLKKDYGNNGYLGIRLLRSKIKQNKEFNEQTKKIKNNLTEEQKLIYDICNFPDSIFFTVLKYVSPY